MSKSVLFFGSSTRWLIQIQLALMKDVSKLGYRVTACAAFDIHAEEVRDILNRSNIELTTIKLNKAGLNVLSDFVAFVSFCKVLLKIKPEIVYLYNIKPVIYGSIAAKIMGVSRIYSTITGLGSVFIGNRPSIKAIRMLVKILYKIALSVNAKVFFLNPEDLNFFIEQKIIPRRKGFLVSGSGVDVNHYSSSLFPKKMAFITVARLIKDKGIYEYIEACEILKKRYPEVVCYLFGSLDANPTALTREELNDLIDRKIVSYIDGATYVKKALNRASVFVLPSYREGLSSATLEAMAMGRPVITTNVPGCRETVIDGVNGYLVPVKDSTALAEAMEKFIVDPGLAGKMGKESRRIAEEKYDVRKVNKTIMDAMELGS